jgi:glycosyltransferase involved in cell wall biosynthesis
MKIAYVVPYVPSLIRTRPYNLIAQLACLGHEVTVFTIGSNEQDSKDAQSLRGRCSDVEYHVQPLWRSFLNSAAAVPSSRPLQSVYSWQSTLARQISQRVSRRDFDIVHVEHLRGSRYGDLIKSKSPGMAVVWDSVDCISHLFRQAAGQSRSLFGRFMTRFELPRTEQAESHLVCKFDHVLVTSAIDRDALLQLAPGSRSASPISVVPNGVDLEYFHPNPEVQRDAETIVFSGKMSYHANIAMARYLAGEIMPRIWQTHPAAHLYIVGKDPGSEFKEFEKNPLITVTGTVDDIRPFLWRATAAVVPLLYGAGIQNKILEAMATGTPVVTTSKALPALHTQAGKELLVADGPDQFSRAVLGLMEDQTIQRRIAEAGQSYVRTHHSWAAIATHVVDIYQQALRRSSNPL